MKTYGSLFARVCAWDNLKLAFKKARKGKTRKPYVKEFEGEYANRMQQLQRELILGEYSPQPLNTFILRDPKTRRISVSAFRDRIVHHALCNVLEPIFEKYFIYDSYANRKGKGVLAALKRFDQFKRKASSSGKVIRGSPDDNRVRGFVLKADLKHYFDTVDHSKLLAVLSVRIRDEEVMSLIKKVLNNYCVSSGKGMPLGNLTSQFFANVYLNELDQFVKHVLKAKYYIRYVDDFVLLHKSPYQLGVWKEVIALFLEQNLLLALHPQKSRIIPLGRGVDFLGFKCFYHFRLLRSRNVRKMERRLATYGEMYELGKMCGFEIQDRFLGWQAYATHANTYRLRNKMVKKATAIVRYSCPPMSAVR
ncbi:hypothetical protein HY639_03565 [Candidatus Woesearchaeota archaeon]|nr:hypothetical protein [Candidatus Woesearchaeota archaeon]